MAYISQLELDQQQDAKSNKFYNDIGNAVQGGIASFKENRKAALDEKRKNLTEGVTLAQAGVSADDINLMQSGGDTSGIFGKYAAKAEEARLKAAETAALDKRLKESRINKDDSAAEASRAKSTQEAKAPKENLTYQQKLETKNRFEQEQEQFKKPTSDQRKVATFVGRIEQSENEFKALTDAGYDRTSKKSAAETYTPEAFKGENLKRQEQAERNFVNAVLRRESGAAIAPSEFESAEKQYFPRVGDTSEVLRQKAENRKIVQSGLKAEAGNRAMEEISQLSGASPMMRPQESVSKLAPADQAAVEWAQKNINDPRAKAILSANGVQ